MEKENSKSSANDFHTQKKEPEKIDYKEFSDSCFSKSICSAMDCTGLIPALPSSEAELDAYEEMYQFCLSNAVTGSDSGNNTET